MSSSASSPAIRVVGLSKAYHVGMAKRRRDEMLLTRIAAGAKRVFSRKKTSPGGMHWALKDISLDIDPGDVVGLIGNNGAGKSTLLKVLARITDPSSGFAELRGRLGSLLEVGTGFHPELTGRENVFLSGAILGMRRAEIAQSFDDIVAFAEVEKFIDTPVKHYSSGMYVRLAFSVATQLRPEILLIDEVLAVGDARFQRKCLQRIQEVGRGGRTIIFVSHNMAAVRAICKTGILLEGGQVAAKGPVDRVIDEYLARMQVAETSTTAVETDSFRIDRVAVTSGSNLVIKTFEPLEIRITMASKVDIDRPGLVARILSANHDVITGLNFSNLGSIAPMTKDEPRELGFVVESLPLLPGPYFVELEVQNRKSREVVGCLYPFEVVETPVYGAPLGASGNRSGNVVMKATVIGSRAD